ncbi:MAG: GGDEF domain-containing protein [Lachnospiraceae bacterium]|nr:GGDEF domain-containing protein [Lachnospiraceae bacterium]
MENDAEHVIPPDVQSILLNIVYIGTVFILYRLVVRNLSELTDRKRQINSKIFLIPPAFFLPVYYVFNYLTYEYGDVLSNIVVNVYSMIVLALFVWAFSVVIMNINASNAASEAQYEAEHDKLTGLYNKGKYMMLKENRFNNPGSIALFNFDVNNLKYINDNFGHEYGDELIIKAAKSIHAVTTDNVFGFRMGGDEYAMVAVNVTEKEAERIYDAWKQSLEELNTQGEVFCVMACGLKYSEGDFDPDELFHQADDLMYLDKKARKDKGETSHLRSTVKTG